MTIIPVYRDCNCHNKYNFLHLHHPQLHNKLDSRDPNGLKKNNIAYYVLKSFHTLTAKQKFFVPEIFFYVRETTLFCERTLATFAMLAIVAVPVPLWDLMISDRYFKLYVIQRRR
jgi:hypothetical protein